MTRTVSVLLWLATSCWSATLRPSPEQLTILSETVDYIFADRFRQAYGRCDRLNDTIPGRPIYHLVYAGVLHAEMFDAEDYGRGKTFIAHIDSSIKVLKKWTDDNPDDPWGYFFLGTAYGYKATWHGQKKSWLKSLIDGLKARGKFAKAIKIDSTLYDAYTGMGNYHYWSSAKLGRYIPFLPDNRDKGLEELRLAADSSLFSRKPAMLGLAWALINEKKFPDAVSMGNLLYEETSGGRASLWILGGAYWRMGNLRYAEKRYSELIESLQQAGEQNYYNLIFCRYRRGVCLYGMARHEPARREFEELMSYDVSEEVAGRHKKTYKKTREYIDKLEKRSSSG
jgi:tetratricopeptide (TPR) repeat protein